VEVTDGTADYNRSRYRISVYYDLAKAAVNRLAFSQGHELAAHGGIAVAITYVGRAVAALAADPARARWNQRSVTSADLAAEYGFTDVDGSRPDVWGYSRAAEEGRDVDPADYR